LLSQFPFLLIQPFAQPSRYEILNVLVKILRDFVQVASECLSETFADSGNKLAL
jgi:hypothetical protein